MWQKRCLRGLWKQFLVRGTRETTKKEPSNEGSQTNVKKATKNRPVDYPFTTACNRSSSLMRALADSKVGAAYERVMSSSGRWSLYL